MKDLGPDDRPREKLDRLGARALGDNELLAVLVGHGTAGVSALAVANQLLAAAGGATGLTRLSRDELRATPGIGGAVAARVLAGVELGRRTLTRPPAERPQVLGPRDLAELLLPSHGAGSVEQFGVVLLDARQRVLRVVVVSTGSVDASVAQPRDVFRPAIAAGAVGVVLFHNHPSGDPTPSPEDVALTGRLFDAGRLLGIEVLDHIVLADATYCSIRHSGGVKWPA
ncbi:MAG: DNA repair protein RadC [Vicinamibacterales bacterium]